MDKNILKVVIADNQINVQIIAYYRTILLDS